MGNQVTSPKLGLVGLRCSVLVSLLWKYVSADMAQCVRCLTQKLRPDVEMKSVFLFQVTTTTCGERLVQVEGL